jgi:hypothetical protein
MYACRNREREGGRRGYKVWMQGMDAIKQVCIPGDETWLATH